MNIIFKLTVMPLSNHRLSYGSKSRSSFGTRYTWSLSHTKNKNKVASTTKVISLDRYGSYSGCKKRRRKLLSRSRTKTQVL